MTMLQILHHEFETFPGRYTMDNTLLTYVSSVLSVAIQIDPTSTKRTGPVSFQALHWTKSWHKFKPEIGDFRSSSSVISVAPQTANVNISRSCPAYIISRKDTHISGPTQWAIPLNGGWKPHPVSGARISLDLLMRKKLRIYPKFRF